MKTKARTWASRIIRNSLPSSRVLAFGAGVLVLLQGSLLFSQSSEDQMQQMMEQLSSMLGVPDVTPEELTRTVEEVSSLSFRRNVPINFMSRESLGEYIRELFKEEYPADFAGKEERFLRAFGFIGVESDLRAVRSNVLNENIAGFYDEREGVKKLFAISDTEKLGLMNQLILAHELRHALQDQHTDIGEKLQVKSDYDDRRVAALCLFEGDATLFMEHYMLKGLEDLVPGLKSMLAGAQNDMGNARAMAEMAAGPALKEAPPIIQEQLIAPYLLGRSLASAIFEQGGWKALNEALFRPPRSTEQVLHPEKYIHGGDEPERVVLHHSDGTEVVFEGILGELYIRVLLAQTMDSESAAEAAAGWGGDSFAIARGRDGERLVWESSWDSTAEALEFFEAFERHAKKAYPEGSYKLELNARSVRFERELVG